jgi:hypothetical protein
MDGFGGGGMSGGGRMGGFDGGHIGGPGGDHVGGLGGDHVAGLDHDHLDTGRRHFGGGYYGYGSECPPYYALYWQDYCGD